MDIPDPILIVVNATVHRTPEFFFASAWKGLLLKQISSLKGFSSRLFLAKCFQTRLGIRGGRAQRGLQNGKDGIFDDLLAGVIDDRSK